MAVSPGYYTTILRIYELGIPLVRKYVFMFGYLLRAHEWFFLLRSGELVYKNLCDE